MSIVPSSPRHAWRRLKRLRRSLADRTCKEWAPDREVRQLRTAVLCCRPYGPSGDSLRTTLSPAQAAHTRTCLVGDFANAIGPATRVPNRPKKFARPLANPNVSRPSACHLTCPALQVIREVSGGVGGIRRIRRGWVGIARASSPRRNYRYPAHSLVVASALPRPAMVWAAVGRC